MSTKTSLAKVAELVDALALGASGATRESSSLSFRTSYGHDAEAVVASKRIKSQAFNTVVPVRVCARHRWRRYIGRNPQNASIH
jgi:hypothetical protein